MYHYFGRTAPVSAGPQTLEMKIGKGGGTGRLCAVYVRPADFDSGRGACGFGLVYLWPKNRRIWIVAMYSLALPVFIESCQLFIGRNVDVDDLILNFTGGCLGAGIYRLLKR